jgi:hypothetical protein
MFHEIEHPDSPFMDFQIFQRGINNMVGLIPKGRNMIALSPLMVAVMTSNFSLTIAGGLPLLFFIL